MEQEKITYESSGVNYFDMDYVKRLAQNLSRSTSANFKNFGMSVLERSRGESAFVWDQGGSYGAKVIEGLGTKNWIADEFRNTIGRSYYDSLAQDTVAMIVNDMVAVGATPLVIDAFWAVRDSSWFSDLERAQNLIKGWADACHESEAVWGGGETQTLADNTGKNTIILAGSAVGIITPKEHLILGDALEPGDEILLVPSSGIHANGVTLAREAALRLEDGYATRIDNGKMFGSALLTPTLIYVKLIKDLLKNRVIPHYMSNITGHGWSKLMRADKDLRYVIDVLPEPQSEFRLIQEVTHNDDQEMYGTFNMGAGLAVYLPAEDARVAQKIAKERHGLELLRAGVVEEGPKEVVLRPNNVVFNKLGVR